MINTLQDRLNKLKKLFPEAFVHDAIDFDRLKELLGEQTIKDAAGYGLHFAGKKEALEEANKIAVSYIAPKAGFSASTKNNNHIFIEGENLEALRLMQETYAEKVKMIYIDPPYNTGNTDFAYADNFSESLSDYNKKNGLQKNIAKPNEVKEIGQIHSGWLRMMYPRLCLAKNLLSQNGVIFISIDHREAFNLKLILDEIFGEENYAGEFIWVNRTTPNDAAINFATDHEFIFVYCKNKQHCSFKGVAKDLANYKNPDNDPKGAWIADNPSAASGNENYRFPITNPYTGAVYYPPKGRYWAFSPKRVEEWAKSGKLVFPKQAGKNFMLKKYQTDLRSKFKPVSSVIQGILTASGTKELKQLFENGSPFKYPKPTALIKMLIEQATDKNDIILDFFAGSGTTMHAVMALNYETNTYRKCICVQLDEPYTPEDTIYKNRFKTVADITKARIELVSKKYKSTNKTPGLFELSFFKLKPINSK